MLTGYTIAYLCSALLTTQIEACSKASEATAIQTGIYYNVQLVENKSNDKAKYFVGEKIWNTGTAIGGLGVKYIRDRELTYKIPTRSISSFDSISPKFRQSKNDNDLTFSINIEMSW